MPNTPISDQIRAQFEASWRKMDAISADLDALHARLDAIRLEILALTHAHQEDLIREIAAVRAVLREGE